MDAAVLDRLYSLAPEEFIAVRDAMAKELGAAGDRKGAAEVKALRKPTVVAWSLNQVARSHGRDVEELVATGRRAREAQEAGDARALREAGEEEHEVVLRLTRLAVEALASGGRSGEAARTKVLETLRAAARDDVVAVQLRSGRLTAETRFAGFPLDLEISAPTPREPPAPRASGREVVAARKEVARLEGEVKRVARRARERSDSARRARTAAEEAQAAAREAEEQLAALRLEAGQAERRLRELEGRGAQARGPATP